MSLYKLHIYKSCLRSITTTCIAVFICFGITACGFTPLHAPVQKSGQVNTNVNFSNIKIANIPNRNGQYLRNQLTDLLHSGGAPNSTQYDLKVYRLNEQITRLGVRRDATSTRAQMRISATVDLVDRKTKDVVLQRVLHATNSYNILESQFSTQISEQYARERILDDIARQVRINLSLLKKRGL